MKWNVDTKKLIQLIFKLIKLKLFSVKTGVLKNALIGTAYLLVSC